MSKTTTWAVAALLLATGAAVTGCSRVTEEYLGTVTELEHEPGHPAVRSCSGRGEHRSCTTTVRAKRECWEVETVDSTGHEREQCIPRDRWEDLEVGDPFTITVRWWEAPR